MYDITPLVHISVYLKVASIVSKIYIINQTYLR